MGSVALPALKAVSSTPSRAAEGSKPLNHSCRRAGSISTERSQYESHKSFFAKGTLWQIRLETDLFARRSRSGSLRVSQFSRLNGCFKSAVSIQPRLHGLSIIYSRRQWGLNWISRVVWCGSDWYAVPCGALAVWPF